MRLDAYDPWLEHRLRVAERQDALKGILNQTQQFALELLVFADTRTARDQRVDDFKMMLAASNPQLISKLYPDPKTTEDGEPAGSTEWSYDDELSPEEGMKLLSKLKSGTMRDADLTQGPEDGWV